MTHEKNAPYSDDSSSSRQLADFVDSHMPAMQYVNILPTNRFIGVYEGYAPRRLSSNTPTVVIHRAHISDDRHITNDRREPLTRYPAWRYDPDQPSFTEQYPQAVLDTAPGFSIMQRGAVTAYTGLIAALHLQQVAPAEAINGLRPLVQPQTTHPIPYSCESGTSFTTFYTANCSPGAVAVVSEITSGEDPYVMHTFTAGIAHGMESAKVLPVREARWEGVLAPIHMSVGNLYDATIQKALGTTISSLAFEMYSWA
jgi:hypothetical protein